YVCFQGAVLPDNKKAFDQHASQFLGLDFNIFGISAIYKFKISVYTGP
ncbi:24678_t:CDS:1, partial [Gigaspora rosea]